MHADDILRGSPISRLFQSLSAESGWAKNWTRFTSTARDLAVYGTSSTLEHRTVSIPERSNRVPTSVISQRGTERVRILFPPAPSQSELCIGLQRAECPAHPFAKNSCSGSPLMFSKVSTAIGGLSGSGSAGVAVAASAFLRPRSNLPGGAQ